MTVNEIGNEGPRQLLLDIKIDDEATFENFFVAPANRRVADHLHGLLPQQFIYLWGSAEVGRTHLLQALCHQSATRHLTSVYVPLENRDELDPSIFDGLEKLSVVCLDDIQAIAGDKPWEVAVFNLFNHLRESDTRLVVSSTMPPALLEFELRDLVSRLQSGLVLQVNGLTDDDKLAALQLRAGARGFGLSDEVARYILTRNDRGMLSLFDVLLRLDRHSLEQKRRVTIPLVKDLMGW